MPLRYAGPLDCFRQSLASDGVRGLYRGISAPLVGAALETSSLFFWERVGRESLYFANLYSRETPLPLSALWLRGAISGAFTSLVLPPVELLEQTQILPFYIARGSHSPTTTILAPRGAMSPPLLRPAPVYIPAQRVESPGT